MLAGSTLPVSVCVQSIIKGQKDTQDDYEANFVSRPYSRSVYFSVGPVISINEQRFASKVSNLQMLYRQVGNHLRDTFYILYWSFKKVLAFFFKKKVYNKLI